MATLDSGLNSAYSQAAASLTGDENRVTVEVEDVVDKLFWEDFLRSACPQKNFHFSCHSSKGDSKEKIKGKSRIMKAASTFNTFHIGCVDGDYDWLLSDLTDYGRELVCNKCLLHTYAYSIENLLCFSSTLKTFCSNITEESVSVDFCDYIRCLSKIIYPLLVWSIYLFGKGNADFTPTAWGDVLISTNNAIKLSRVDEPNLTDEIKSVLLSKIENLISSKVCELERLHANELDEKKEFETYLCREKGVTPDNAYLYIRGHDFYSHLVHAVIAPVVDFYRKKHYDSLKCLTGSQKESMLNAYSSKNMPVEGLLYRNYRYKQATKIYNKIAKDASGIWT